MEDKKGRIFFKRYPGQPSGVLQIGAGDSAFFDILDAPGVYIMRDRDQKPLYIGKAKSLRKRIASYRRGGKDVKTRVVLARTAYVEFIVTNSDAEALVLENNFIKEHHPRYNINLRDDKKYPFVKITSDSFPRIYLTRKLVSNGSVYLGPYVDADALRGTLHLLRGIFKIRTCRQRFGKGRRKGPCLNFHINRCMAPCQEGISEEEYAGNVRKLRQFLEGGGKRFLQQLKQKMKRTSADQDFESAARIRDTITSLERILEEQMAEFGTGFEDFLGCAIKGQNAVVVLLSMVAGKMIDRESYFLSAEGEISPDELLSHFMMERYSRPARYPRVINLPQEIEYHQALQSHISRRAGRKVLLKRPQRGRKRRLVVLAERNAELVLAEEIKREQEHSANTALVEIQQALSLDEVVADIEGIDISTLGGVGSVGSVVHFRLGKPYKKLYRRYKIQTERKRDDYAMIAEVVSRRFRVGSHQPPQLLLIDGGKGQLSSAKRAADSVGVDFGDCLLASLAKGKRDKFFAYIGDEVVNIEIGDRGLSLLSRVRDEAHRFARSYQIKTRKVAQSVLDEIAGIGEVRRINLLRSFPGRKELMRASVKELASVEGIGESLGRRIYEYLHGKPKEG